MGRRDPPDGRARRAGPQLAAAGFAAIRLALGACPAALVRAAHERHEDRPCVLLDRDGRPLAITVQLADLRALPTPSCAATRSWRIASELHEVLAPVLPEGWTEADVPMRPLPEPRGRARDLGPGWVAATGAPAHATLRRSGDPALRLGRSARARGGHVGGSRWRTGRTVLVPLAPPGRGGACSASSALRSRDIPSAGPAGCSTNWGWSSATRRTPPGAWTSPARARARAPRPPRRGPRSRRARPPMPTAWPSWSRRGTASSPRASTP